MNRVSISLSAVVAVLLTGVADAKDAEVVKGKEVGQSMPLHVVHFVAGARESGKGCPSVMISNRRTRGLEIWAQTPSDEAFALAAEMEPFLDEDSKNQAFIIVGKRLPNEDLVALAKMHGVKETTVCIPNSKKLFQHAEFNKDRDLYVFFIDRKEVIARHDVKASQLTPESRQELAKKLGAFLRSTR